MSAPAKGEPLRIVYQIEFENGTSKRLEIALDPETLGQTSAAAQSPPEWTLLKYNQCENCPLGDEVAYCPVAINLATLVQEFQDFASFEEAKVTVETKERTYTKTTSLQKALSSVIGLTMVTSDCPIMDNLRPMARFHLPFATSLETFYRAVTMYLTAQFFISRKGGEPDWDLKKLVQIYKEISKVNKGIARRLSEASRKDASINAVVILHSFGDGVPYFIEDGLNDIEYLFEKYIGTATSSPDSNST